MPHVRVGLGEHEPRSLRVVLQVQAGSGADLEHIAFEVAEEPCAAVAQAGVLGPANAAVVGRREESAERHELAALGFRRLGRELAAELLDPTLGRVELRDAEAVQLFAPLPQRDRVLERGLAALELSDDALELGASLLEGQLGLRVVAPSCLAAGATPVHHPLSA